MTHRLLSALLIIAAITGNVGATLFVGMLVCAIQWNEWGSVVIYSVTTAVCVEMIILSISKQRDMQAS